MYTAHFKLTERPFAVTPDPRYLYMSDAHREALAHLLYGIGEGGGFVQLTGEVGTGKTTLCRCLLEQLPPGVDVALILNPKLTDIELLAAVCDELRITYPAGTSSRKLLVDELYRHLLDAHAKTRRTVVILDEAQDLAPDVLEQIRLLTNLETSTQKLLQVILIGQPELIRLLERQDLRQLSQRVTARYHLVPFSAEDTAAYIRHRLGIAGQKERIFTASAVREIHRASRGVPRLINAISDRALLGAYSEDDHKVSGQTARRAAREVLGRPRARRWPWAVALAAVALAAGALIAYERVGDAHPRATASAPASRATAALSAPAPPEPVGEAARRARRSSIPEPSAPGGAAPPGWPRPSRRASAQESGGALSSRPEDRSSKDAAAPAADAAAGRATDSRRQARPAGREPSDAARPGSLAALLADPAVKGDKPSAFASLYARWGLDFDVGKHALGCERGRAEGLRCLFGIGSLAKLRRIDLPAILELGSARASRRYATLVALDDRNATLEMGGRRFTLPGERARVAVARLVHRAVERARRRPGPWWRRAGVAPTSCGCESGSARSTGRRSTRRTATSSTRSCGRA